MSDPHDEYAALDLRTSWPVASLACFLAALAARFLVRLLPPELVGYLWRITLPALAVPVLCTLGLLLGLLGLRSEPGSALARLGILLNAVGLLLGLLFLAAFVWILWR